MIITFTISLCSIILGLIAGIFVCYSNIYYLWYGMRITEFLARYVFGTSQLGYRIAFVVTLLIAFVVALLQFSLTYWLLSFIVGH